MAGQDRYEEEWHALVAALDGWTSASVVAPDRIEVALPGSGRRVVVVMTPEEWGDMVGIMFGRTKPAIDDVKEMLLRLQPHEGYAVYCQYQLEAATGPTLPRTPAPVVEPGGEWVVLDAEGRVVSRFSEWQDPTADA